MSQPPVSASRILRAAPRRHRLTKTLGSGVTFRSGFPSTTQTFLYIIPIETPCLAARVGFGNPFDADMVITKASFYSTDSYSNAQAAFQTGNVAVNKTGAAAAAAPIYFDNAGVDVATINSAGSSRSLTLSANAGNPTNAAQAFTIKWSDFVPVVSIPRADGSKQHLLMVAITIAAGSMASATLTSLFTATSGSNIRGRDIYVLKAWNGGTDFADNIGGVNWRETANIGPLLSIQYIGINPGIQVMLNGDSISAAPTNDGYSSAVQRAAWDLSTPQVPIEVANFAWGGQPQAVYEPYLRLNASAVVPGIVAYQPNSRNDGEVTAALDLHMAAALANAQVFAAGYGAKVIWNMAGCDPSANGDSNQQAAFTAISALMAQSSLDTGIPYIDGPSAIGDVAGGKPWNYLAGFSDDNTHPNWAGAEAVTPAATRALSHYCF